MSTQTENRRRVLDMLAENKISVDEAERLLSALDGEAGSGPASVRNGGGRGTHLRVVVTSTGEEADDENQTVDVRVPLSTLRAGLWLPGLLPDSAADGINQVLVERGMDLDVRKLKDRDIDRLLDTLEELEIDVNSGDRRVLIYVE